MRKLARKLFFMWVGVRVEYAISFHRSLIDSLKGLYLPHIKSINFVKLVFKKSKSHDIESHVSSVSIILFCVLNIFITAASLWELKYHAYFMYEVPSWSIVAADWTAIMVCLVAVAGLLSESKSNRKLLLISFFLGTMLAVFWLHYFRSLATFRWDAIWLPLGPMSGAGFCIYVDHLLMESSDEVRKLRGYMYAYKAI
ncbi:hypothetical protein Leryth_026603 [Lithospermum erythrorhizon]|nr:hypothetical protein Leryth_026603 [Lithospermum erythrorhizon]